MPLIKFPSEGEPTKEVTAPVIVTTDGEEIVHEDAVTQIPKSVADHIINGDVDPDATDKGGTQSVIDQIITGLTEANPSRDEGVSSVSEHVITGDVANGATDDGALQAPTLPVKVTSGKLGPGAGYNGLNFNLQTIWHGRAYFNGAAMEISGINIQQPPAGYILFGICYYDNSDYYTTPTFADEVNLTRIDYDHITTNNDYRGNSNAFLMGKWEVVNSNTATTLTVELGPSASHGCTILVGETFEFFGA